MAFVMMELSAYPWRGILLTLHGDRPVEARKSRPCVFAGRASDGIDEFSGCQDMSKHVFH